MVLRGQDSVKHYTVLADDDRGLQFGLAKFANVTEFVQHFQSQPLIGGESGQCGLSQDYIWTCLLQVLICVTKILLMALFIC